MHKNIEPTGISLLSLLLAIAILIGLIVQSFSLRNIENKIDNFTTAESTIYSGEQTVTADENTDFVIEENPEDGISS